MKLHLVVLLAVAFLLPAPLLASTYTYTYTGSPFTFFLGQTGAGPVLGAGVYTTSDFVSGSFTLGAALPLNGTVRADLIASSFSFSDGVQSTDSGFSHPLIAVTTTNGIISHWIIGFLTTGRGAITSKYLSDNSPLDNGVSPDGDDALSYGPVGIWTETISTTPEPSTLTLAATGLFVMAGVARRKLRP